jgi:hypothetical protein
VLWLLVPVMSNLLPSGGLLAAGRRGASSVYSSGAQTEQSLLHGIVRDERRAVIGPALVQATQIADDAGAPQNVPSSGKKGLTAYAICACLNALMREPQQ